MRMTPEHYQTIKARVTPLLVHVAALREQYAQNPKIKDIDCAIRWKLFHAARIYDIYTYQQFDYLDAHIDTAMRAIIKD